MFEVSTENVYRQLFHPAWKFESLYGLHSEDTLMAPVPHRVKLEKFSLPLVLHLDNLVAKLTHLELGPFIERIHSPSLI